MAYQVNEIFTSIQGEGLLTGSRATFIRLQGCTVGCPWCDSGPLADSIKGRTNGMTSNTWGKGGKRMSVKDIVSQVEASHVIITGGEPTLYNLDELIDGLHAKVHRCFIQIETSGQNELKGDLDPNWITWSPKKNLDWKAPEGIMRAAREVKWVVDEELPFAVVERTWAEYRFLKSTKEIVFPPYFVFMPEGCPPRPEMMERAQDFLRSAPGDVIPSYWRFGDRLQYRLGVR